MAAGVEELRFSCPCSCLRAVCSHPGTSWSGSCATAMAYRFQKDTHKTKGSHLLNENYSKLPQHKIPEGACWLDQRHKGNESQLVTQSERTSADACQDSESHYEKNSLWWGVKDSKIFQSRLQMKIHSDSLTCTVLQRLSRLFPSILTGWSHHCRCLCKLF